MNFFTTKKWALITVGLWLITMVILSVVAPTAKEVSTNAKNGGLPEEAQSIEAKQYIKNYFPTSEGAPLFVVMHYDEPFTQAQYDNAIAMLDHMVATTKLNATVLPLAQMPSQALEAFTSKDKQTFFVPITVAGDVEGKVAKQAINKMAQQAKQLLPTMETYFTGPVAIAGDAYDMFTKADVVLMISTVFVILLLLIMIYRSPLLALIPLIGAGIVYMIVDRVIGLAGEAQLLTIDGQALSIMLILLFAVITDYSLLIFSRFREELMHESSPTLAMKKAMKYVREPIIFSGSTILLGMLTLFFAMFEIYRVFAPVFAVAVIIILVAGLTLLPALFEIAGAKAFWPFNPHKKKAVQREGVWHKIARYVIAKPWRAMLPVIVILIIFSTQITTIKYTFNLLDSFPEDMSSIQGYQQLEKAFSKGDIAPTTVVVEHKEVLTEQNVQQLADVLAKQTGVQSVTAQRNSISQIDSHFAKLTLLFKDNPYDEATFDLLEDMQQHEQAIVTQASLQGAILHYAGETAEQSDIRAISEADLWRVGVIMIVLIGIMLGIQTRSIVAPIYMMATILLSFGAALGITVIVFQNMLGYSGLSYRTPLYAFVFLMALGVDYSIMLMARIREEQRTQDLKTAVLEGVGKTGGVISSAGLLLAATFAVLMTQPVLDLRVFGFAVFIGVLIDTFLVRTIVIPALLIILDKWSFWPKKMK